MQKFKTFFLCTDAIEHSFAYTELLQAAQCYEKVYLITLKKTVHKLPSNVTECVINLSNYSPKHTFLKHLFLSITIFFGDIFSRKFNWPYYKTSKSNIHYLVQSIYLADVIEHIIVKDKIEAKHSVFVSFWFNTWAIALSVLKKKGSIPAYFSRTHGTDLFEYRVRNTQRIPFRLFQLKWVNRVYSVSKNGENYLKERFPHYAAKIATSYLGTAEMGSNLLDNSTLFTIVSCAKVRNIKRIFLIPEILQHLNFKVLWIHLGDENLEAKDPTKERYLTNKENLKQFPFIKATFAGDLSNEQIFDFYKTTPVNLFLSVSETEGLPVSIMEAISFGIPVMATDVGGCREIVTDTTGILIPKDFDVKEAARLISEFYQSEKNKEAFRKEVKSFWKTNFEVSKNYHDFFEDLERS